ncbi:MAG: DUF4330 family protein [Oscillospiraceae bacterium]|nr:DUF4330 family protein [Oscillospiraceae bacterium]
MKEVKEREKKSGFNIIDLIIILFIILAVVGIIMRYNLADTINLNAHGETFEIEFLVLDIQEASQQYLVEGKSFYMTTESIKIGEITTILDIRPAVHYSEGLRGDISKTERPGRIDVTGIMTSTGRTTKEGHMINGNTFVAPNKELYVHTGEWEGVIRVLSVKKINE